jgi:integrase/recombinase XerD
MKRQPILPTLIERFFTERLIRQRNVSPHTIASYRDTFRLLLKFTQRHLKLQPSCLELHHIDAPLIVAFLDDMEANRAVGARTRNLRLTALRSFFRYAALEEPAHSAHIQRILLIPSKRHDKRVVHFLTRPEIEALLAAPNTKTWVGRRDHALLRLAVQTGLRLSELIQLDRDSVILGRGAHVRCTGKGRKERCTPLTVHTVGVLRAWLKEARSEAAAALFPSVHGEHLSADAVQYLLRKYVTIARTRCASMKQKRVSVHVLRHSAAMELLQAGVDCSVIALWLGHESVETTQIYIHAHMALKEAALSKVAPMNRRTFGRYRPNDQLLQFLNSL